MSYTARRRLRMASRERHEGRQRRKGIAESRQVVLSNLNQLNRLVFVLLVLSLSLSWGVSLSSVGSLALRQAKLSRELPFPPFSYACAPISLSCSFSCPFPRSNSCLRAHENRDFNFFFFFYTLLLCLFLTEVREVKSTRNFCDFCVETLTFLN